MTTELTTTESITTDVAPPVAPPVDPVKGRLRAMWASGDYDRVAFEVIPDLGQHLVDACGLRPGQRVLDVAAGSGNAAIPAARAGAEVTASDLTPELLERGRSRAEAEGLTVRWEPGDAERLPYEDAMFDAVLSCVGVMFAPNHAASAAEMLRVTRPGGLLAVASWTPEGFIGRMFSTMKPYAPPPPPGAQPPPLWGVPDYVTQLFGDGVDDLSHERRILTVNRFADGAEFLDFFKRYYGPTIAVYAGLADQPERAAELDAALIALADESRDGATMDCEYLLVRARRR